MSMSHQTVGEMRMELAEHQREQQRLRDSIEDVCYGCVAGGDDTAQIPPSVEHHAAGDHACAYHWPEDECGVFPNE